VNVLYIDLANPKGKAMGAGCSTPKNFNLSFVTLRSGFLFILFGFLKLKKDKTKDPRLRKIQCQCLGVSAQNVSVHGSAWWPGALLRMQLGGYRTKTLMCLMQTYTVKFLKQCLC